MIQAQNSNITFSHLIFRFYFFSGYMYISIHTYIYTSIYIWVFEYSTTSEIRNEASSFEMGKRSVEEGLKE